MRPMKRFVWAAIVTFAVAGCNSADQPQSATAEYLAVRDHFFSQQGYAFYGQTRTLNGASANGNAVNFSGQVQGKDVFLHVKLSVPEQKRAETMSLLSRNQRLYADFDGNGQWVSVQDGDVSIWQEFENWSPVAMFAQMDEMRSQILPLRDPLPQDDIKAVRVTLDSRKLKDQLARQMKQRIGGRIQSDRASKLKLAMNLSDGDWRGIQEGARIQAEESRREIDELVDNMKLEAEYTLFYDQRKTLPTRMVMNIRSQYDRDGNRVVEHTEVDTYIRNYGQQFRLPDPDTNASRSRPLTPPGRNDTNSLINDPNR